MALPKSVKNTVLALLVLVIPGICYMLLRTGTNYYHSLPVFGPDGQAPLADDLPDSAYYRVKWTLPAAGAENQLRELENKMYVAGFVRGRVTAEAETLAVNMVRLAKTYSDLERLRFVTFIATDIPSAVTPFEQMLEGYLGPEKHWINLRVGEETARDIAEKVFLLELPERAELPASPEQAESPGGAVPPEIPERSRGTDGSQGAGGQGGELAEGNASAEKGPLSDKLVLVDSRNRIRGYYDGSSYFDTDTLEDEIVVLLKEELNNDDQQ